MKADINVTPLIDVLLVLLIIFMVVVPVAPRALDASVPDAGGPGSQALVLEVRTDGYALNTAAIGTKEELAARLREAFATRRDATLIVRVGDGVVYDRVIDALDTATGAGAGRIGLTSAPPAN